MAIFTWVGNLSPSDFTSRITLPDGSDMLIGENKDINVLWLPWLQSKYNFVAGVSSPDTGAFPFYKAAHIAGGGGTDPFYGYARINAAGQVVDLSNNPLYSAPPINSLYVWGHSFANGFGAPAGNGMAEILQRQLKAATLNKFTTNGALIASQNGGSGAGGIGTILQNFSPARTVAPRLTGQAATAAGVPLHVLVYGLNDLSSAASSNAAMVAFRSAFARCRESQVFESTNGVTGITYGPTGLTTDWNTNETGYLIQNSGTGIRQSITSTAWVKLTTPADFEGGWVNMRFVAIAGGTAVGTITSLIDGVAGPSFTYDMSTMVYTGQGGSFCLRAFIPTAGVHTFQVTMGAGSAGFWFFDSAAIEATHPPLVVSAPIFNLPNYNTGVIGTYPQQPSDARINAFNAAMRVVAAEFTDGKVIVPSIDQLLNNNSLLYTDFVHPGEIGHRVLGNALYKAVLAATSVTELAYTA